MNLIETTKRAIELGRNHQSKLSEDILKINGFSSPKNRHFLNNLIQPESRYMEIGVWKGSTLISALYKNNPEYHVAIDNFCEHGGPRKTFHDFCQKYLSFPVNFIDTDCFSVNPKDAGITNINTYFYDGRHNHIDQYKAVTHYYDCLASEFVYIVDDWNMETAKSGTKQAFKDKKIKVLYSEELPASKNGDKENWWNGLYVAVCTK